MFKLLSIAIYLGVSVHSQVAVPLDENRPTRYISPYAGLDGLSEYQESQHYYKANRRSERIPTTPYQYDENNSEEDYYRAQLKKSQDTENYPYQNVNPTQGDYQQLLKTTHLSRLRANSKKQAQSQVQNQQPAVEQYLKEVSPTTQTVYQRPSNYLRFSEQQIATLKQEPAAETRRTVLKQPAYRYVLQSEPQQQKLYPQYQHYEPPVPVPQEPVRATTPAPHFNLVAYQNALLAQQKLLANQEDSKSSIYVAQNIPKKPKIIKQKAPLQRELNQQYDYYQREVQADQHQRQLQHGFQPDHLAPVRYQEPTRRPVYHKHSNEYKAEEYSEQREVEQYQVPVRQQKQKNRFFQSKYHQPEEQTEDYQEQTEDSDYRPLRPVKYQHEKLNYRRPIPRKVTKPKYSPVEENGNVAPQYSTDDLSQYQSAQQLRYVQPGRHVFHYVPDPEIRQTPRFRQQYQEESRHYPQYHHADLIQQGTIEVPTRYRPSGRILMYNQELQNSNVPYYRNLDRPISYIE